VLPAEADISETNAIKLKIESQWFKYRENYYSYYNNHKRDLLPAIRDNEFYLNAINVMKEAEAVSEYVALPLALVQFLYQL